MKNLSAKIPFAALWLLGGGTFYIYRTMAIKENAFNASLLKQEELNYLGVFILFAILSLVLNGKLNRMTNIIASICVGLVQIIVLIDGTVEYGFVSFNFVTLFTIIAMVLVSVYALKIPKESAK